MTAPLLATTIASPSFWAFVGVVAGIYTIFALGLQLQFGFTGLLNFGHVAFMAISAYTMAILIVKVEAPMWAAAPAGIAVAMVFGLLIGLPTLRLRADYLAITTIAFGEIVRYVALNQDGLTGGPIGTINLKGSGTSASYNGDWLAFQGKVQHALETVFGDMGKDTAMLAIVWTVAIALIVAMQVLVKAPWGRVLRSIREDEDAASSLGKNVFAYKLQALALGAALAAVAGLFFAFQFSFFSPQDFDPLTTFFGYIIVILAGTARNWAVPVGAVIFGVIFAGTRFFEFPPFTYFGSADRAYLRLIVVGLILIGLMAFRPQGLLGKREEMVLE
ncbi:MAG: branched-chain amino acid ABC transporter permease [Thermoleophilia bacterium]|nr:branched-chain amino acid ABC transporter permease [Thermoleophilia bacterium]